MNTIVFRLSLLSCTFINENIRLQKTTRYIYRVTQKNCQYSIHLNPFTLRVPVQNVVCYFHTFENDFGIKRKFTKYLKESCCFTSGKHFSFKYFPKNAFVGKIFPKCSGLFWLL